MRIPGDNRFDAFMNVKQVSDYLHLNEKKIYALVGDGKIPATKITGKWLFPRELIDKWMLDSTHNGLLQDRLLVSGSDDPLLYRITLDYAESLGNHALVSYNPNGTRGGLSLLETNKVDVCCMHWGPENEAHRRHPSLLQQYSGHQKWVLIRAFKREQGLITRASEDTVPRSSDRFFNTDIRWSVRQQGSGTQRFLLEELSRHGLNADSLNITAFTLSEREAAAAVVSGRADVAPATRAIAGEFGLGFISLGWQAVDFVIPRNIWFRHLFQNLLKRLQSDKGQKTALELGGYDLAKCGDMVWCED